MLQDVGPTIGRIVFEVLHFNTGIVFTVVTAMGSTVKSIVDVLLEIMVLFTALIGLMISSASYERQLLSMAAQLVITDSRRRERFEIAVLSCIRRTLRFTIKMPTFHLLFTWFTYQAFNVTAGLGCCFWSLATAVVVLLAVLPVWVAALPGALELWLTGHALGAIMLLLLHVLAASHLDPKILLEQDDDHSSVGSGDDGVDADHGVRSGQMSPYMIGLCVYGG
eukprot:UC1_evm1s791